MKHFDKLKNKLRPEKSNLPEGFGWEDMRDDIMKKMDEDSVPTNISTKLFNKFFFMGIGFLVGIAFITFLFLQREQKLTGAILSKVELKNDPHIQNKREVKINNLEDSPESNMKRNETLKISNSTPTKTNIPKLNTESTINNVHILKSSETQNLEPRDIYQNDGAINSASLEATPSTLNNIINPEAVSGSHSNHTINSTSVNQTSEMNISDKQISDEVNFVRSTSQNTPNNEVIRESPLSNNITKNANAYSSPTLTTLNKLPLRNWKPLRSQTSNKLNLPESESRSFIAPVHKRLWTIEIGGGWNTWSLGLTDPDEIQSLYSNFNADYGFSFTSRLGRKINRKLSVTTGLDIDIMYKKLNLSYTELEGREVKNALVGYKENAISGEIQNIYADTIVMDTTTYSVTNYNKYQLVTIPLIANYNIIKNSNWSLDIGFGPSISFLTNYQGKYFENNELRSFDTSSNLYTTSPKIALNASLQLRKKFVQGFYIGFRMDLKNHLNNWAVNAESGLKPKVANGLIVIGMEF